MLSSCSSRLSLAVAQGVHQVHHPLAFVSLQAEEVQEVQLVYATLRVRAGVAVLQLQLACAIRQAAEAAEAVLRQEQEEQLLLQ